MAEQCEHKIDKKQRFIVIALILIITLIFIALVTRLFLKEEAREHLTLYGNIEIRQVDLGFRIDGRIVKMFKEEGDYVKKGDELAILDDIKYKAEYEKTLADIETASAQSANALSIYNRHLPLCTDSTTSKEMCETYLNNKDEAQSRLEAYKNASKIAKDNLDNTIIYAPNDGIITTRVEETGAVIRPSSPVYTLSLHKPVWVRAYVNETNLGNIKYGMKARVITDSINPATGKKREYEGWIGYISPVAEFTPKTVETTDLRTDLVYRIRVYVFEVDDFLRQGMPVSVKVDLINPQIDENLKVDDE